MGSSRAFKTAALIEVNQNILEVARESIMEEQEWEFFCECGNSRCHEHVKLTIVAYGVLHDEGCPVLADGHRLSQIERARRLREDAEGLRAQAKHQGARAKKNLG